MDCIFCKIVNKEIQSRSVFENERVIAFHDINPKAPVHVLLVPKKHVASVNDLVKEDGEDIAALMLAARPVAEKLSVRAYGYKLVLNVGKGGGQVVDHIHMHLLAWPAGDVGEKRKEVVPV